MSKKLDKRTLRWAGKQIRKAAAEAKGFEERCPKSGVLGTVASAL